MAFYPDDDREDGPPLRSEAEITLKKLLDKQLSTSARLEQMEFQHATESMHSSGHGSSGICTLSEFVKNELAQRQIMEKTRLLQNVLHGMGYSEGRVRERCQNLGSITSPTSRSSDKGTKRSRYGADPLFLSHSEAEDHQIASLEFEHRLKEESMNDFNHTSFGGHSKELETSLLRGKDRLQANAHLSEGGTACRKPLFNEADRIGKQLCMTPQERARYTVEKESSRPSNEVFSRSAPEILELHDYLNQKTQIELGSSADAPLAKVVTSLCEMRATALHEHGLVKEIPEEEIVKNRLSQEEIRKLPCGKFASYSPGTPSNVLYIKNLSKEVTEADLAALFVRYQGAKRQPLLFRLMKRGRMKGQAFVTFPDEQTSSNALEFINGYKLKGKPMVMEFGHCSSSTSCNPSE